MGDSQVDLVVTPGLGDNSYVLSSDGEAVLVDPQRDVERLLEVADRRGAAVRYSVETHVHNDYVSGAFEVRERVGADVAGPARAGYAFPHVGLTEGDELRIGRVRLRALATPGHTPEHLAYAIFEDGGEEREEQPVGVFTGGSLIVGSAGRTDLLGTERTEGLTRDQYRTLRKLRQLPPATLVLPTHGAGSFCASSPPQEERTSTIGRELASNPAVVDQDEEAFVRRQLSNLLAYPAYYTYMAPINRAGPAVVGDVPVPPHLPADRVAELAEGRAWVVDARDGASFAGGHVPGSINVPLEASFASYVGWLLPFDEPLVVVLPEPTEPALAEVVTQLFRIGYEQVLGCLDGGTAAWRRSGGTLASYPAVDVDALLESAADEPGRVLDVRQRTEWDQGHLPGTRHVFVADLPAALPELSREEELTVACASGYRSSMAASLLARAGIPVRVVARDGVPAALRRRRRR